MFVILLKHIKIFKKTEKCYKSDLKIILPVLNYKFKFKTRI